MLQTIEESEDVGEEDCDIVSLGAQAEEVLDNGNEETADSDEPPPDDDFVSANDPEESEVTHEEESGAFGDFSQAQSASMRAATSDFINADKLPDKPFTNISDMAFKVVKTGSAPANTESVYYRSFRVKPRGRQIWRSKRFVDGHIQYHYHRVE